MSILILENEFKKNRSWVAFKENGAWVTYFEIIKIKENGDSFLSVISAAPELYEALEDVLGLLPPEFEESPMVAFAKAALEKARGPRP